MKKSHNNSVIAFFLLLLAGSLIYLCNCGQKGNSQKELQVPVAADTTLSDDDSPVLDSIFGKILKLKMVQAVHQNIQKVTNGERGVAILLGGEPTVETPFYLIHVGFNGEDRFETYFFLRMNKALDSIFVNDLDSGDWKHIKN